MMDDIFRVKAITLWLAFGIGGAAIGAMLAGGLIGYENLLRDGHQMPRVRMAIPVTYSADAQPASVSGVREPEAGMRGF